MSAFVGAVISPSESEKMGFLGMYAKFSPTHTEKTTSQTTPDVGQSTISQSVSLSGFSDEVEKPEYNPVAVRLERWALQSVSRKILNGSPIKRIKNCLRVRSYMSAKGSGVDVLLSLKHKAASFAGLQTCASVWACPICAAKIAERRKTELQYAIECHTQNGGEVLLLTLTNPHYLADKLSDVLDGQALALKYFNKGAAVDRFNKSIGYIGQVRAYEVTHGRLRQVNNGWHPHFHILLFVNSGLDLDTLKNKFYDRWLLACIKADLPAPSFKHGINLKNGDQAAKYVSKWGLEDEMTKGHVKKSLNGETPFDFLRAVLADDDRQAAGLFLEFAVAFKGKQQLRWSPGLKSLFDIKEMTDDQVAAAKEDRCVLLGSIAPEDWPLILKYDVRGEILELARGGSWDNIQEFIGDLRRKDDLSMGIMERFVSDTSRSKLKAETEFYKQVDFFDEQMACDLPESLICFEDDLFF